MDLKRRSFIQYTATGFAVMNARAGTAGLGKRPNVVFIVSDQQRRDSCGCYDSPVKRTDGSSPTPVLDRFAAEGIRFDRAYCNSPLCAPSRASYHTGVYPHTTAALYHRMDWREAGLVRFPGVRKGLPTLGEVFRAGGYRTAAIGKMHVHGETPGIWDMGYDVNKLRFYTVYPGKHYADEKNGDLNARYREYKGYEKKTYREIDPVRFKNAPEGLTVKQNKLNTHYLETLVENEEEMYDHRVTTESIRFIDECVERKQPFMIHVGLEKPHPEWTTFQRFLDEFDPAEMPLPETVREWTKLGKLPTHLSWIHNAISDKETRNAMAAYYACVADLDEQVGRIMDRCRALGVEDDTVFIFSTDHGEMLFDHGLRGKHNMYEESTGIPLLVKYAKAFKPGSTCKTPVSLIDVFPTLTGLCGLPAPDGLEGESLRAIAGGKGSDRLVFSEFYQAGHDGWPGRYVPQRMAVDSRYKYIYTHGCIDQLFDLKNDPKELKNLAIDSKFDKVRYQLRLQTLQDWEIDSCRQLGLKAVAGKKGVSLEWESIHPEATYAVYRSGTLLKAGCSGTGFIDRTARLGETCSYQVLATIPLKRTYTDHLGHSRYGNMPVMTENYPTRLPITGNLEIRNVAGATASSKYTPWNGATFAGHDWIWTGYPAEFDGTVATCKGTSFITSDDWSDGDNSFSAVVRTRKPGSKPEEQGSIIFRCSDTDHYYELILYGNGKLLLNKVSGLWKKNVLKKHEKVAGVKPGDWNRLGISIKGKMITASVNGKSVFKVEDKKPLPGGFPGFCVPRYVKEFQFKDVEV
jgi:arylsulfatase A-like enzyme